MQPKQSIGKAGGITKLHSPVMARNQIAEIQLEKTIQYLGD